MAGPLGLLRLLGGEPTILFNSTAFLFGFLPVTYGVYWMLRTQRMRHAWLAATGYAFYAFWDWRFCGLMVLSTLVSFLGGLGLSSTQDRKKRLFFAGAPILVDLSLLGVFKYADMASSTASGLLSLLGFEVELPLLGIVLPIGISFYTLHTITYVADAYRGAIRPTRDLLEFATYVSFFAQLVAGPIVRFGQIERDLESVGAADRTRWLDRGCLLFAIGLSKKVLVADTLARFVDPLLAPPLALSTIEAWLALVGYGYQLYFDFSGYSDMALGLGLLFGLRLPRNFDAPYRATDPADFWRRWHISLSTLLRDYLFSPMGGTLGGVARACRNLVATMLIGGLWHGASWTFVLWGGYHGALLSGTLLLRKRGGRVRAIAGIPVTFLLVSLGWVLFRSTDLSMAGDWYATLLGGASRPSGPEVPALAASVLVAGLLAHLGPTSMDLPESPPPALVLGLAAALVLSVSAVLAGRPSPFLYFQF